ncbi:MAG TPA: class I SAM-dependent methyltransferase [Allosphingosinicella sp.]|jgi:ubiquinone/menaquinone biosynthesis C-methylase UbiE
MQATDAAFSGSIPALYDSKLGPLLFEPYAQDIARRAADLRPRRILETAAGTGIVTSAVARELPKAGIVATDLNQAMLDIAAARPDLRRVMFRQTDAQALPFPNDEFDLVVCQFGVMFFPDRIGACREALRVLAPGGTFLFNVWDSLDRNPVSAIAAKAVAALFPDDPPSFLQRVPFGYHDERRIEEDLRAAGFGTVTIHRVAKESRIASPRDAASGLCLGSPLRAEIEARAAERLDEAAAAAEAAMVAAGYGPGAVSPLSALVVAARA